MSNLEKFLASYGNYLTENTSLNMDVDSVLKDVAANISDPGTDHPELSRLYTKGAGLSRDIATDLVPKIRNLKDDKIYEVIVYIEHLNNQLNKEYEEEVKRGIEFGIYDRTDKKTA